MIYWGWPVGDPAALQCGSGGPRRAARRWKVSKFYVIDLKECSRLKTIQLRPDQQVQYVKYMTILTVLIKHQYEVS